MPTGLLPTAATVTPTFPQEVVETFLARMADADITGARALLDEQVVYVNVGLPAIRGRRRVGQILGGLARPGLGFEVYLHAIAAEGATVLTERTDVLVIGPVRLQFWVTGRFDVGDGKITLWRDSFDYVDVLRATVRGVLGAAVPPLRPKPPSSPDTAPGRH